jgi:hypothetical protein
MKAAASYLASHTYFQALDQMDTRAGALTEAPTGVEARRKRTVKW